MPLSPDPKGRAAQLANLRPAPPAPVGNDYTRTHGGYAAIDESAVKTRAAQLFDLLSADAPLRDGSTGRLPNQDRAVVMLLAKSLTRIESIEDFIEANGVVDPDTGEPRMAVLDLERRLRAEAASLMGSLGLHPLARTKLGLDVLKVTSLADAMSEEDPIRRAELLREAGA